MYIITLARSKILNEYLFWPTVSRVRRTIEPSMLQIKNKFHKTSFLKMVTKRLTELPHLLNNDLL